MNATHLYIELNNSVNIKFRLFDAPLTHLWLKRMALRDRYPLDHPNRFYGLDNKSTETSRAVNIINQCISTINEHEPIIERTLSTVNDQDTLNYLHNIFERYHGLLDQQDHSYWNHAPDKVKRALAELNLAVHRCESVSRGSNPRFVCTWYGLPKTEIVQPSLIQEFGNLNPPWGSVCINYAEIGKTLEDLTKDNDNYIAEEAFKPFSHYSADFVVRLYEDSSTEVSHKIEQMKEYYNRHQPFFANKGYNKFEDPELLPYRLVVAEIDETKTRETILEEIRNNQLITKVYLQ